MNRMFKKILIMQLGILYAGLACFSQDTINKVVRVVAAYTPVVSDANKINFLPEIKDTFSYVPSFTYQVLARQINVDFETEPLRAAKMVGEPEKELKGKYLN